MSSRLDPHRLHAGHELHEARLPPPELDPGRARVGAVEEHGRRHVRLVVGQGHPGDLGVSGRGILRQDPALLARGPPDRVARPVDRRLPRGIDPAHREGVGLGRDPDPRVDRLGLVQAHRGQVRQLVVGRVLEEEFAQPGQVDPDQRVRPAEDHRAIAGLDQRPRLQLGADGDRLARGDPQAIVDQQVRPAGHQVFGHARACFPIGSRPGRGEMTSPRISRYRSPPFPATHHPRAAGIRGVEPGSVMGGA